jgi:hypothetical protein
MKKTYCLTQNKFLIIIITVLFFLTPIKAQDCKKYYKIGDCAAFTRKEYYMMSHSKSAMFEIGVTSEFEVTLNKEYDYIISCCTEKEYYPINFVILSKDNAEVIYDNMYNEYINSIGFTLDMTQTLIIRVTLLAENFEPSDFEENRACIGVSVQFRKTPKIGF